jgi:hypothetical protein
MKYVFNKINKIICDKKLHILNKKNNLNLKSLILK